MFERMWPTAARLGVACLLVALVHAPAFAAGFAINEHGGRAMGMANAVTAQAEDGSTIFFNVGGLGFLRDPEYNVGLSVIQVTQAEMQGLDPFPGAGFHGNIDEKAFYIPHLYYVRPLGQRTTFGFAINSPFGLAVEWLDPDNFPGRFISLESEVRTFDLSPAVGYQLTPNFSVGVGAIMRFSDVGLKRRVPLVDPISLRVVDVAGVELDSDLDNGFGWTAGFVHKLGQYLSWGASYRSNITVDYGGDGTFTQIATGNPLLDALVAQTLPFGAALPVETSIEFPDTLSVGVAMGLTKSILLELDVNWWGWSSFDELPLTFVGQPALSAVFPKDWENTQTYRAGIEINGKWRFGVVFDESPQPTKDVGPLLPDSDRTGYSFGFGTKRYDLAVMYLDVDERVSTDNQDGFFGVYQTEAWLFSGTIKF